MLCVYTPQDIELYSTIKLFVPRPEKQGKWQPILGSLMVRLKPFKDKLQSEYQVALRRTMQCRKYVRILISLVLLILIVFYRYFTKLLS